MTADTLRTLDVMQPALEPPRIAPARAVLPRNVRVLVFVALHALLLSVSLPCYGQPASSTPAASATAASRPTATTPIDARTTSCADLQSLIRNAGMLPIASVGGAGDVFHARAPQCEFWQRPQYVYVTASDGRCGAGFVCVAKIQGGR